LVELEQSEDCSATLEVGTMERRLIVMRHAKSAWDTSAPSDHARPLNDRGRTDAPKVAERLVELGWVPELVISSDATRTQETWAAMKPLFDQQPDIRYTSALYMGGLHRVQAELLDIPDEIGTLMVLGHNPGWEEMVSTLCGETVTMTTANAALLVRQAASWSAAIEQGKSWQLRLIVRPRELD
jgi:phosphohistidine phosphatase